MELKSQEISSNAPKVANDALIDFYTGDGEPEEILHRVGKIPLCRKDFQTLEPNVWINDNVIDSYMILIAERSRSLKTLPSVYCLPTFLFTNLMGQWDKSTVSEHMESQPPFKSTSFLRWTRKMSVFSTYDLVFIPIFQGQHWSLVCVDNQYKTINYYDSIYKQPPNECLTLIKHYIKLEIQQSKGLDYSVPDYKKIIVQNVPQQNNFNDCGVFLLANAEFLSRSADLSFHQRDIPKFRQRIAQELRNGRLITATQANEDASTVSKTPLLQRDFRSLQSSECLNDRVNSHLIPIAERSDSPVLMESRMRRVTFSNPLFEQCLLYKDQDTRSDIILASQYSVDESTPDSTHVKEKVSKATASTSLLSAESDVLADNSSLPVSALLVDCKDDVSSISNDLTTSNCDLDDLQKDALEKLKTMDDWGSGASTSKLERKVKESHQDNDVNMEESIQRKVVGSLAEELLCSDKINLLPTSTLVALAEKCFKEITRRLKN